MGPEVNGGGGDHMTTEQEKKQRRREAQKRYRQAHPQRVRACTNRWINEHYDHYRAQQREYLREWRARRRREGLL